MIQYLEWLGLVALTAAVVLIFGMVIYVVVQNAKDLKDK